MNINKVVEEHQKWLNGEGGKRANLAYVNLACANLKRANLAYANLAYANLRGADLEGANLRYVNLGGANLRCVNLTGANLENVSLWDCTGNNKEIKSIFSLGKYQVTYTAKYLQIGCQRHKITDWWLFSDDVIDEMDAGALDWWRENKDLIRMTIEKHPATPTGKEE